MPWTDHITALARYNRYMNQKLYALAAELQDAERKRDRGAFFKSIHGTLNHLLLADRTWMSRLQPADARYVSKDGAGQVIPFIGLDQQLYEDFATLRREREQTDEAIVAWASTLSAADLEGEVAYHSFAGTSHRHSAWWAISQLFNHQTHHRGQLTTLFSQLGKDPGVTDLIYMLREEAHSAQP